MPGRLLLAWGAGMGADVILLTAHTHHAEKKGPERIGVSRTPCLWRLPSSLLSPRPQVLGERRSGASGEDPFLLSF